MTNEISSERRVEVGVSRIAAMMREVKAAGGRIAVVAGPVVVHTGGAAVLSGADSRAATSTCCSPATRSPCTTSSRRSSARRSASISNTGKAIEGGHRHHMRAINTICRAGGLQAAVEQGVLTSGVMYECIRHNVDYVLAGSIRDDGPLPDTIMDLREAQDRYAAALQDVRLVLALSTMLHGIGVGNMLPSWVRMVCVDINPAVVTKLADRGSSQTIGDRHRRRAVPAPARAAAQELASQIRRTRTDSPYCAGFCAMNLIPFSTSAASAVPSARGHFRLEQACKPGCRRSAAGSGCPVVLRHRNLDALEELAQRQVVPVRAELAADQSWRHLAAGQIRTVAGRAMSPHRAARRAWPVPRCRRHPTAIWCLRRHRAARAERAERHHSRQCQSRDCELHVTSPTQGQRV